MFATNMAVGWLGGAGSRGPEGVLDSMKNVWITNHYAQEPSGVGGMRATFIWLSIYRRMAGTRYNHRSQRRASKWASAFRTE